MTEKQARYFILVYEKKNIALAAQELYVSRPVISRTISDLEREFGAQLFSRTNTGVIPTDAGVMVYNMLSNISANYNATIVSIKGLENSLANRTIRFGVTPTNANRIYDVLLRGFMESFPEVKFSIIEKPAGESIDLLLNNNADMIFTPQETKESCYDSLLGYRTQFSLGISEKSPLALKQVISITDIFDVTFGTLCSPMPLEERLYSSFSSFGKKPNISVRSTSLSLLKKLAQNEEIVVVLPNDMMEDWENVSVVPLDFINASTHRLVWNKLIPHNSAFFDLLAYARQNFGEKSM